ncbi:DNA-packaging protein small subunit [Xanthomonas phage DES1]|nr:DNA-packaging protein small subunit [Xanthomonas phage DES1]
MSETTAGWARKVYDMYAEGAGDAEVAAELKLTLKQFYQQISDNDKFATLIEFGRTMSQAWWERNARKNINNKQFNTSLWSFYMKNKHGWADKIESTGTTDPLNNNLDQLKQEVEARLAKYLKKNNPELTDAKLLIEGMKVDETSE